MGDDAWLFPTTKKNYRVCSFGHQKRWIAFVSFEYINIETKVCFAALIFNVFHSNYILNSFWFVIVFSATSSLSPLLSTPLQSTSSSDIFNNQHQHIPNTGVLDQDLDHQIEHTSTDNNIESVSAIGSCADSVGDIASPSTSSRKRKHPQMETNEILRQFLENEPKPSDFLPPKPADDVQQFFDSMATTVRKFSPLDIAKVKLKVAQIVGEHEIVWAEQQATTFNKSLAVFNELQRIFRLPNE